MGDYGSAGTWRISGMRWLANDVIQSFAVELGKQGRQSRTTPGGRGAGRSGEVTVSAQSREHFEASRAMGHGRAAASRPPSFLGIRP